MKFKALFSMLMLLMLNAVWGQGWAAAPKPWQMGLQDAVTPVMERIVEMHNIMLVLIGSIAFLVFALLIFIIVRFRASKNPVPSQTTHSTLLEIIWTAIPTLIVVLITIPSVKLLCFAEQVVPAQMTLKITGRQWYWSYEYVNEGIKFDSYLIKEEDLKPGQLRLLEVDNRIVVPVGTVVRLELTSSDVIHSWTIPSFGVKKDTVPGRLNLSWFRADKEGVYFGQCSELCGMEHGFMPIVVEVVSQEAYAKWLETAKQKFSQLSPQLSPQGSFAKEPFLASL